jgi:alpha-galactosidase
MLKGPDSVQLRGRCVACKILHVPFDNDMWFRYNSVPAARPEAGQLFTSDEVTAIYDNTSRRL